MHTSSLEHMARLIGKYLHPEEILRVIDIGSYDVNGSYRQFFNNVNWTYIGVDIAAGKNVDVVLESPYELPFETNSADLIISGQAFEHIEFFWVTWVEMVRVLKPNGKIFLLAPSRGGEHRYPVDCWRYYPDGFRALAKYAGLNILEVHTDWTPHEAPDSAHLGDTVGAFEKPSNWNVQKIFGGTEWVDVIIERNPEGDGNINTSPIIEAKSNNFIIKIKQLITKKVSN